MLCLFMHTLLSISGFVKSLACKLSVISRDYKSFILINIKVSGAYLARQNQENRHKPLFYNVLSRFLQRGWDCIPFILYF